MDALACAMAPSFEPAEIIKSGSAVRAGEPCELSHGRILHLASRPRLITVLLIFQGQSIGCYWIQSPILQSGEDVGEDAAGEIDAVEFLPCEEFDFAPGAVECLADNAGSAAHMSV